MHNVGIVINCAGNFSFLPLYVNDPEMFNFSIVGNFDL